MDSLEQQQQLLPTAAANFIKYIGLEKAATPVVVVVVVVVAWVVSTVCVLYEEEDAYCLLWCVVHIKNNKLDIISIFTQTERQTDKQTMV